MGASVAAGTKLGRYEIVKHLATGGMADLLLARADGLEGFEHHVVIKRIRADQEEDPGFVDMFLAEARLAAALHHHNIVQVHDIGQEHGKPYFAMEYVHGEDLRHLLGRLYGRGEQVPLQHVITIIAAVATALHHAHEQKGPDRKPLGIVHRDVTPANILVGYDGNVKVVDFGIARAALRRTETQAGMLKGKAPYMAPEQCTGGAIDRRSDVFALGIVMYELATVRRLFKSENEFLTMSAVVKGTIPKPSTLRPELPDALDEIIMRALAREPAARYQTAEQLFNALDELAISSGIRTSASALATYMKQVFGERVEPWVTGAEDHALETAVDFDDGAAGIVAAPSEAVDAQSIPRAVVTAQSSPIVRARENVTTTTNGVPIIVPKVKSSPVKIPEPTGPAPTNSGRVRVATPAPVPAPTRNRPKTIQIPVTRVQLDTAVMPNPLATPQHVPTPAVELDDDAQLPRTAVVPNPLTSAQLKTSVDGEPLTTDTAVVPNPLIVAEKLGEKTEILSKPPAPSRPASREDTFSDVAPPPAPAPAPAPSPKSALPTWSRLSTPGIEPDTSPARPIPSLKSTASAGPAPQSRAAGPDKAAANAAASAAEKTPGTAAPLAKLKVSPARPGGAAIRPKGADAGPGSADARPGSADARPGSADSRPSEADARPADADSKPNDSAPSGIAGKPRAAAAKLPLPRGDVETATPTTAVVAAKPIAGTDGDERTEITPAPSPPPMAPSLAAGPLAIESAAPDRDSTALVKPLPSPLVTDSPRVRRATATPAPVAFADGTQVSAPVTSASKKKLLIGGALAGVLLIAGLVFAIGGSGDAKIDPEPSSSETTSAASASATDPVESAPEARPARTWANSEKPDDVEPTPTETAEPTAIPVADPATEPTDLAEPTDSIEPAEPTEPAAPTEPAETVEPTEPAETVEPTEPATKVVAPKKPVARPTAKKVVKVAAKPAVKKPVKKPAKPIVKKPATKPSAKPKWDPNSLFPKKK